MQTLWGMVPEGYNQVGRPVARDSSSSQALHFSDMVGSPHEHRLSSAGG